MELIKKFRMLILAVVVVCTFFSPGKVALAESMTIEEGLYTFKNVAANKMMNNYAGTIADGNKVTLWDFDGTTDQRFKVDYLQDGKYLLWAYGSTKVLDVYRGTSSLASGQKVDIWQDNDRYAQEVYIEVCSDGSIIFRMVSNKNLAIGKSGSSNGDQLQLVAYNKDDSGQRWYICNTKGEKINVEVSPKPGDFSSYTDKSQFTTSEDITLKWSTSANATSYGLTVSKDPYGSANSVWDKDGLTGNSVNIGKLPAGSYRFNMIARNSSGESSLTALTYFTVVQSVTAAPATATPPTVTPAPSTPASIGSPVSVIEGYYNIVSASGGRYLNVYAGTDKNGTNVCVWQQDGSPEQNYYIKKTADDKYTLRPQSSSNRYLDIYRGNDSIKAGQNIDIWDSSDTLAQEFYFIKVGDKYVIESANARGLVLQVNGGSSNNDNVTLEKYSGASNQLWTFKGGSITSTTVTAAPATVTPSPSVTTSPSTQALATSTPVAQNNEVGTPASIASGNYNIVNANGDKYLNVYAGNDSNQTNVCVWAQDYTDEQNFYIKNVGSNVYTIQPKSSNNRLIDIYRGTGDIKAGQNIDIWDPNDNEAQQFYFIKVDSTHYVIEAANARGLVLQANSGKSDNDNVTLEKYTGSSSQLWTLKKSDSLSDDAASQATADSQTMKPSDFSAYTDKLTFSTNEEIVLRWETSGNAESYGITMTNEPYGTDNIVYDEDGLTGNSIKIGKLPVGKYRFNMIARNSAGDSKITELTYFSVIEEYREVTKIESKESNITIMIDDTYKIDYTVYPENATNKAVSFSTNDSKVASVDSHGKITAINEGTAKIAISSKSNEKVVSIIIITVEKKKTWTMYVGSDSQGLRIRDSASVSGKVIYSLNAGDRLTVEEKTDKLIDGYIWAKVKYQDITGWVAYSFLDTSEPYKVDRDSETNLQYAIFPMKYLNISQGVNGGYSHYNSNAIDLAGRGSGTDTVYAPFDCVVKRIYTPCNGVWIESTNKVIFADGTIDYMTILLLHDNNISNLYVGKIIKQGEAFYQEGTKGKATGNHVHLNVARGKYKSNGWYEKSKDVWELYNSIHPEKAFYLAEDTVVINGYNYKWKKLN